MYDFKIVVIDADQKLMGRWGVEFKKPPKWKYGYNLIPQFRRYFH